MWGKGLEFTLRCHQDTQEEALNRQRHNLDLREVYWTKDLH